MNNVSNSSTVSSHRRERSSGILVSLFSLPGPRDVGSLGRSAREFVDFLAKSKQRWFQMLPVNPIDEVGSPYAGRSAFAGETLYLDLEEFRDEGLLDEADLVDAWLLPDAPKRGDSSIPQTDKRSERIDYAAAFARRSPCWKKAFERYRSGKGGERYRQEQKRFEQENNAWLEDYVLFQTAAENFGGYDWSLWPEPIRRRDPDALKRFAQEHAEKLEYLRFLQLAFDVQWREFHEYCASRGIKLFGDVPIYVGRTSSDVWSAPELFSIDEQGKTIREAGVPADAFNPDGQRWNSPIYRWDVHQQTNFRWWKRRMCKTLERFDAVRLDHFIGFYNYYSFDGKEILSQNAIARSYRALKRSLARMKADPDDRKTYSDARGRVYEIGWTPGPQEAFLDAIFSVCPKEAFIAEDLGVMTKAVRDFRDSYGLPGMQVFQFCFDNIKIDEANGKAPDPLQRWSENFVAYTGTHDGAPILGWLDDVKRYGGRVLKKLHFNAICNILESSQRKDDRPAFAPLLAEKKKCFLAKLFGQDKPKMGVSTAYRRLDPQVVPLRMAVLRAVAKTPCKMAIFPIQDVLGLSNDSRINYPGVGVGNWTWRLAPNQLTDDIIEELADLTTETQRTE